MSFIVLMTFFGMLEAASPSASVQGRSRQIEHFSPADYGAYPQNWAITLDDRGFVYVGNRDGILQYDGSRWRVIRTDHGTTVRSLATDAAGRIYVGAQGELGFLEISTDGEITFRSLLDHIPVELRDFGDVWTTVASRSGIFFQTKNVVFRWDGMQMSYWVSDSGFHTSFSVSDRFFVREIDVGLLEHRGGSFFSVPDGEYFSDKRISAVLPFTDNVLTIVTRDDGLFRMDQFGVRAVDAEVTPYLRKFGVYSGRLLSTGDYALATLGGGLVISTPDGRLQEVLEKTTGLSDDVVNFVAEDNEGNLWLALNSSGIARIDFGSPVRLFGSPEGLEGTISHVSRSELGLMVSTSVGVFIRASNGSFERLDCVRRAWSTRGVNGGVLIAADEGLFFIDKTSGVCGVVSLEQSFTITQLPNKSSMCLVGTRSGFMVVGHEKSQWSVVRSFQLGRELRSLMADSNGWIWAATRSSGLIRFRLSFHDSLDVELKESRGLPEGRVNVNRLGDDLTFSAGGSLYDYDWQAQEFVGSWAETVFHRWGLPDSLLSSFVDLKGVSWLVFPDRVSFLWQNQAGHEVESRAILRFPATYQSRIFVDASGVAWISRGDELFRYDPHVVKNYENPYGAFVRKLTDLRTDSTLFGGNFQNEAGGFVAEQPPDKVFDFEYELNNLRFEFAAPTYNAPEETVFQYRLVGHDAEWSPWSRTNTASFSDLPEGSYTFIVRARNGFGFLSDVGTYSFHLLPPWYRTWWAYSLYLFGGLALVTLSWKYVSMVKAQRRAKEQARELARERVINERLNEANDQLQVANVRLQEAVTLKDEFLATTSHELRTPITAILGYASILREEIPGDYHEFVDIIEKSGQRLMATLNSLLDLAKLRAGTMEVNLESIDLGSLLTKVVESHRPIATAKGVTLGLHVHAANPRALVDDYVVRKAFDSLLNNAIKFTEQGSVEVTVLDRERDVEINIADTGVGIDEKFLPALFDEFRQESGGLARTHSGNGLGLAIAGQIIDLLSGSIEVRSQKGKGSTFTVILPRQRVETDRPEEDRGRRESVHEGDRNPTQRRAAAAMLNNQPASGLESEDS